MWGKGRKERESRAAGGRCNVSHLGYLATPRTCSRFTLALVLQFSKTGWVTLTKDMGFVLLIFSSLTLRMECECETKITVTWPTLHSNREPLFGKGAYTVQSSPTTMGDIAFPLCTHPSTLNRKKCAVQVHLTEQGGVATFGQKELQNVLP